MKHPECPLILLAALSLAAGFPRPAQAFPAVRRLSPPSFLAYRAETVTALASEVSSDPAVRARLARHFHLSGSALCAFVRTGLSRQALASPCLARVYYVGAQAQEYAVESHLPTGTPVFVSRSTGQPVLLAAGGNPIVALGVHPAAGAGLAGGLEALSALSDGDGTGSALVTDASSVGPGQVVFTRLPGASLGPAASGGIQASPSAGDAADSVVPTMPGPHDGPSSVPEPGPVLTLALGALLLGGLGLRRRLSAPTRPTSR